MLLSWKVALAVEPANEQALAPQLIALAPDVTFVSTSHPLRDVIEVDGRLTLPFEDSEGQRLVLVDCLTLWLSNVMLADADVAARAVVAGSAW